jgi:hypothetical protein
MNDQNDIVHKLKHKNVSDKCVRCKKYNLVLLNDIYDMKIVSKSKDENENVVFNDTFLPCFVILCQNCGFMMHHSVGILGLLDKNVEKTLSEIVPDSIDATTETVIHG